MAQEGLAHRVRGMIARKAIQEHDDELMSAVGGEGTHNVHRESVPRSLGLYSPRGLLAVAIIIPSLALWATLGHLYADSAASFVKIAVAK